MEARVAAWEMAVHKGGVVSLMGQPPVHRSQLCAPSQDSGCLPRHARVHVCPCVCIREYMHVFVCESIGMHVHTHIPVHVHANMYIYMCVYT